MDDSGLTTVYAATDEDRWDVLVHTATLLLVLSPGCLLGLFSLLCISPLTC